MAFVSLDIPNFRALRNLKVEELRRINILVGKNNSGKTSLLEAVELLCLFPSAESVIETMANSRKINSKTTSSLSVLNNVHEGQSKSIIITGKRVLPIGVVVNDFSHPKLSIAFGYLKTTDSMFPPYESFTHFMSERETSSSREIVDCKEFHLRFCIESIYKYEANVNLLEYGPVSATSNYYFRHIPSSSYNGDEKSKTILDVCKKIPHHFIPVNIGNDYSVELINNLILNRKFEKISDCVSGIDKRIKNLKMISDGNLFVDQGEIPMLPLSSLGEGINRIVRLLTYILSLPTGGVCLIDEIDTGLHYTALPVMWRAVLQAAENNKVQIFATTHSDECVEALIEVLKEKYETAGQPLEDDEEPLEKADCALYRLEQEEDGTKAYRYDMDALAYLTEANLEVR